LYNGFRINGRLETAFYKKKVPSLRRIFATSCTLFSSVHQSDACFLV